MGKNYTADEERALHLGMGDGVVPPCPRCGGVFSTRAVPPRADVPYVRNRLWLVCDSCGRSALIDLRFVPHHGPHDGHGS